MAGRLARATSARWVGRGVVVHGRSVVLGAGSNILWPWSPQGDSILPSDPDGIGIGAL